MTKDGAPERDARVSRGCRTAWVLALCVMSSALVRANESIHEQRSDALTVILVRHAERESSSDDTPISAAGRERAQTLATVLRDVELSAIFVSDRLRTQQTASPVATQSGLTPQEVATDQIAHIARKVRAEARGAVLFVHHSNTVPMLVEQFGGKIPRIADDEFDRLVIVTVPLSGEPLILTLRYGAASRR